MKRILQAGLIGLYLLALLGLALPLPLGLSVLALRLTLIVLCIHGLETLLVFRHLRKYAGPLWHSVLLSLLYGLLHWLPLVRPAKAKALQPPPARS